MVRPVGRIGRQLTFVASEGAATEFRAFLDSATFQSVSLSWLGTLGGRFRVYRDRVLLVTVTGNAYTDTGVLANTAYTYQIAELDGSNNEVAFSPDIGALTPVAPPPDPDPTPGDVVAPDGGTLAALPLALPTGFIVVVTLTSATDAGGMDYYTLSLDGNFLRSVPQADFSFDAYTFNLGPGDGLVEGREYLLSMTPVDLAGNAGDTVTATFTTPVVTPRFQVANLGTATPVLSAGVNNLTTGEVLGTVGGTGIGGTADSGGFVFVAAPADDNFSVTGRVASLSGGNPHGGLMIRESAAAGAAIVALTVAADGASLRTRATTGANAVGQSIAVTPPIWLRLEYASGTVTASTSPDGVTWTVRGTAAVTFNGIPLVGYAFASRVNGTSTTGAFDNFASVLTPPDTTAPTVPTLTATVLGTSSVRLDWTASTDAASGVKEYRLTRGGVALATVPFGTNTYTDTGLAAGTAYTYGVRAVDHAGNPSAEDTENATTTAVASDLGSWLPIPEITINAGFTGNIDTPMASYYVPPSGQKLDSLAISTTNETGGAVTPSYPSGVTGSIVSNTALRLACTSASAGTVTNLHLVPTISAISSSGGSLDDETSWTTRSAGAIYANNFNQYSTSAELSAAGAGGTRPPASHGEALLYTGGDGPSVLSGGKCLEIRTYDLAEQNGGNWSIFIPRTNNFYLQFSMAVNKAWRDWVRLGGDGNHGAKFLVVNQDPQAGVGQIALYNPKYLGFPGVFVDSFNGVERRIAASGSKAQDWFYCTAIDNGGAESTNLEQITRYGPSRHIEAVLNPRPYNGSNAAANYVDGRGFTHPHPNAIASGVPEFPIDDWITLELFVNVDPVGDNDVARLYAAHRGDPPKLIWKLGLPLSGAGSYTRNSIGGSDNGYIHIMFLNYPTNAQAEPGYRPVQKLRFAEPIIKPSWIGFKNHEGDPEPT